MMACCTTTALLCQAESPVTATIAEVDALPDQPDGAEAQIRPEE
ncbi:hypothetical protein EcB171_5040 [Escherichia coli B171]|uniref:Uncharacterized protein n=1 Tax=Shigella dysenteriae 1 TaxID=984897 RepID=A0A142CM21_SHIDY|nr:hypothetical protein [Shigella dysenteriae 1]EDX27724.1 hypothetical protein EcB171_3750 [Escherichia coli B171]ENA59984.1 hypothetical protein EC2726950_5041 [Escherichia coli 2726950]ENB14402.1 hypothetical protein ECBCE011MS01_5068 [Escherichia coli BCE011_MS-01]KEL47660.1 hypothetical protein AB22_4394 [Escherichia coli 6-175-07_S1_C1]